MKAGHFWTAYRAAYRLALVSAPGSTGAVLLCKQQPDLGSAGWAVLGGCFWAPWHYFSFSCVFCICSGLRASSDCTMTPDFKYGRGEKTWPEKLNLVLVGLALCWNGARVCCPAAWNYCYSWGPTYQGRLCVGEITTSPRCPLWLHRAEMTPSRHPLYATRFTF